MNSALQKQVTSMQNVTLLSAHKIGMPKRFKDERGLTSNCRRITDTKTGKTVIIDTSDYRGVRLR
jgi:hypothetical protein